MSVKGVHGDTYTYVLLSKFTYIMELRRLQPNVGQAISSDSYWKEFCDWATVTLPYISRYFSRNVAFFS